MIRMFLSGSSMEDIGIEFLITRQRVQQILKARGIDSRNGGYSLKREERAKKCYGCSVSELDSLSAQPDFDSSSLYLYRTHKSSAQRRKIPWEITFPEWWSIWKSSGRWNERGVGIGQFCMCRNGDQGSYSANNVYIGSFEQNSKDGNAKRLVILAQRKIQYSF